jgi:hypothetical protein
MESAVRITIGQIEAIRSELAKVPPKPVLPAEAMTKMAAVASLAPELLALRRNGWSLEAIVGFLAEKGLHLTAGTLKNYLQRAGATRSKRRRKKESASGSPPPTLQDQRTVAADLPTARQTSPAAIRPVDEPPPLPSWSFRVREDTEL